jgi:hypothetical protein
MVSTVVWIVFGGANAVAGAPPFLDTGFGPAAENLQLAVQVDATGTDATFVVKNTGTKPLTIVEAFSCSGTSPWSISAGATEKALDHHWNFEPRVGGLTTKHETGCTRNVPTKQRTLAAGSSNTFVIPFAKAGEITKSSDRAFRATAVLDVEGRPGELVLLSATQMR